MNNVTQKEVISKASGKWILLSPSKARLVADLIRGNTVSSSLEQLEFCDKKAAGIIRKILLSAAANAQAHKSEDPDNLLVKIEVGSAGHWKRMQPRAFGRASMRLRRRSHIWIELHK